MQESIDRWFLFLLAGLRTELDATHPEYVRAVLTNPDPGAVDHSFAQEIDGPWNGLLTLLNDVDEQLWRVRFNRDAVRAASDGLELDYHSTLQFALTTALIESTGALLKRLGRGGPDSIIDRALSEELVEACDALAGDEALQRGRHQGVHGAHAVEATDRWAGGW